MVTPDLVKRGLHAGDIVKQVAGVTGGSGGGTSWQLEWTAPWAMGSLCAITTRCGKEPWVCGAHATILKYTTTIGMAEERLTPGAAYMTPEVWPNPCRGLLSLRTAAGSRQSRVFIHDRTGRLVRSLTIPQSGSGNPQCVDLRRLPDGVYFVSLSSNPESGSRNSESPGTDASPSPSRVILMR
jgi:hypothetical protein